MAFRKPRSFLRPGTHSNGNYGDQDAAGYAVPVIAGIGFALALLGVAQSVIGAPLFIAFAALFGLAGAVAYFQFAANSAQRSVVNRATVVLDSADVAVLVTRNDGSMVSVNQAARKLLGWAESADASLERLLDQASEDTASVLRRVAQDGFADGRVPYALASGRGIALDVTVRRGPDALLIWTIRDVSELAESTGRLAAISGLARHFVLDAEAEMFQLGPDGSVAFTNEALNQRLLALNLDLSFGLGLEEAEGSRRTLTVGGISTGISCKVTAGKDGSIYGTLLDASGTEDMADAFARSEKHLQRFFDITPVGVLLVRQDGTVRQSNAAYYRMSGNGGDVDGEAWLSLLHSGDHQRADELFQRMMAGEDRAEPIEVRLNGDRDCTAQLYCSYVDVDNDSREIVLYLIDTTEKRDLELQFAQSQKMQAVGQLAGGVAHDFNNLLTAMIGFSDLLLMRHPPGDPSYSDIIHIKQNANRAAQLVKQLLAFSRRQTLRPTVLDLTEVLAELTDLLRRLIGEQIELKIVHGRDLGPVKADQGQMEQVITNIVVNARDAMQSGGRVTITTRNVNTDESRRLGHELMPAGDYVEIEVSDTGHGIAKEDLGKIFEPFFTTKEVGQGTGLGLSTVYGIIKQTGGYVFVNSEVGRGTAFRIYLPWHVGGEDDAADEEDSARKMVDLTGKGVVLLVEDEDAVRMFAARALRNKGYTVLEADSGEAALGILDETESTIDLMISDVVMPNMNGPTLVKQALETRPDMRIIFISGYAEEAFRKSMDKEQRRVEFLPKPFSLKQLASKVKDTLDYRP